MKTIRINKSAITEPTSPGRMAKGTLQSIDLGLQDGIKELIPFPDYTIVIAAGVPLIELTVLLTPLFATELAKIMMGDGDPAARNTTGTPGQLQKPAGRRCSKGIRAGDTPVLLRKRAGNQRGHSDGIREIGEEG